MTDRRDDDFRVRPSAPKNRGKGQGAKLLSKVLRQAGKASDGKSAVHRPGAAGTGQRPARGSGAAIRRRASPGRSYTHVAARDHQDLAGQSPAGQPAIAPPSTCATSSATARAAMANRAGPTGRRPTKPT
ncbi:hypothetical protein ACPA9J_02750 [Pseudomonas aeruginosa]